MLFSTLIAPSLHTFSHALHPIHPALHTDITCLPNSLELHCTLVFLFSGTRSIKDFGHVSAHFPHPTHASSSM